MATSSSGGRGLRALLESVLPAARFGDERTIMAGTGQNLLGLIVAMIATFATQVLITRVLGAAAFGVVTVATQLAFVGAAATRFGMDMASVRTVAIHMGAGEPGQARGVVRRAAAIAAVVSTGAAAAVFAFAEPLARAFTTVDGTAAFRAAAIALPFAALVHVYLGATRGLKVMRHTLTVYWVGQPLLWIALMLAGWVVSRTVAVSVLAYAGSWALATIAAVMLWHRDTRGFGSEPLRPGATSTLLRYGAPRAPAALFAHLLFWIDLFVLARVAPSAEVGIYAAAVRAGQVILLFLVSVNNMFSPFVADLHARGERDRLDALYKLLTRWMLAATLPIFIVLAVAPEAALRLFGEGFGRGRSALLILLVGQLVNVSTGSVGFILIMVGRTGWDLVVSGLAAAFSLVVASVLAPRYGMEGAAVAGALTLALGNLSRLVLVRRFVRIQPFTRDHLRLLPPVVAGAAAAMAARAATSGGAWQLELVSTAAAGTVAYLLVLLWVGLPPGERHVIGRLLRGAVGQESRGVPSKE